jgi:hypothetical protein
MITRLHLEQPPTAKPVVELAVAGPVGRWFMNHGWSAFTLPLPFVVLIFYWNTLAPSPYTRVHEFVHVDQDERGRFFLKMWIGYLVELARRGYRRNRYEIEAYRVEALARADGLPDWAS